MVDLFGIGRAERNIILGFNIQCQLKLAGCSWGFAYMIMQEAKSFCLLLYMHIPASSSWRTAEIFPLDDKFFQLVSSMLLVCQISGKIGYK